MPYSLHANFITAAHFPSAAGPGTPPPPPPPPPPPVTCSRIATNQRGVLASLIEPVMAPLDIVHGVTSNKQGLFVNYAYEQFSSGTPDLTWTYTVNPPDNSWENDATNVLFLPNPTWTDVQNAINAAGPQTRITCPGSLPDQMQPLSISGKTEIIIDFSAKANAFYAGGDATTPLLLINNSDKITVLSFRCACSAGNRTRGVVVDGGSTDIDFRMSNSNIRGRVFGCTDGFVFPNSSNNERVRIRHFDSLGNTQNSLSTDRGYGAYLGDATDLTIDDCFFEAGDSSGEHALRIPYPTRCKIIDTTTRVSLASAQKRCLWIFGATDVQITNFTAINQRCDIGLTQGTTSGGNDDGQGGGSSLGIRIDGFTSNNCQFASALSVRCGGFGDDPGKGTGWVRDFAIRNASWNNPANAGRCINVEWRDRGDRSRDIVWVVPSCFVNGSPMVSSNWVISADWSAAEAAAKNIGPASGATSQYQQYVIMQSAGSPFVSDEVLEMDGVTNALYKTRLAADGGVSQTSVSCATGQPKVGTPIALFALGPQIPGPGTNDPTFRFDLDKTILPGVVASLNAAISTPEVITTASPTGARGMVGATGLFVRFEAGTPGKIVLSNLVGVFRPGDTLSSPDMTTAGMAYDIGNPTNQIATA